MLKIKKVIFVIVGMIVMCLTLGSISFATETPEPRTITPKNITAGSSSNNTNTDNTNTNTNENTNTNTDSNTNTNNDTDTNTNTNTNTTRNISTNSVNKTNNISSNTNSNSTSGLPYAGTKSSVVFVGVAFIISAIYAYKKISEYRNV